MACVQVSSQLALELPNLHILLPTPRILPTPLLNVTPLPNVAETLGIILGINFQFVASPIVLFTPKLEKLTPIGKKKNKYKHFKHQKVV